MMMSLMMIRMLDVYCCRWPIYFDVSPLPCPHFCLARRLEIHQFHFLLLLLRLFFPFCEKLCTSSHYFNEKQSPGALSYMEQQIRSKCRRRRGTSKRRGKVRIPASQLNASPWNGRRHTHHTIAAPVHLQFQQRAHRRSSSSWFCFRRPQAFNSEIQSRLITTFCLISQLVANTVGCFASRTNHHPPSSSASENAQPEEPRCCATTNALESMPNAREIPEMNRIPHHLNAPWNPFPLPFSHTNEIPKNVKNSIYVPLHLQKHYHYHHHHYHRTHIDYGVKSIEKHANFTSNGRVFFFANEEKNCLTM